MPPEANFNEVLAVVSVAGFATQRSLELLDPLFIPISKFKLFSIFGDEKTAKAWCMAVAGFAIGLVIAGLSSEYALPYLNPKASMIVVALAISMGSNATNSLLKFGEHAKEARKIEVEPLPEIAISPKTVEIAPGSKIKFLASVSGADNRAVSWRVLEVPDGGIIDVNGDYTAPAKAGTYHVATVSDANPAATATATITVK